MFGMSEETNAKVLTGALRLINKLGLRVSTTPVTTHYDVLVIGSGFGGSVSALRLTEKGYTVGVLEAGARFEDDELPEHVVRREEVPLPPGARLLRHPAHRHRVKTA